MPLTYIIHHGRTYDRQDPSEVARVLGIPLEHKALPFKVTDGMTLEEIIAHRVKGAYLSIRHPCFIEESSLHVGNEMVYLAGRFTHVGKESTREETEALLQRKLFGESGIAKIAVAYTADGQDVRVFQGDIPRTICAPQGKANTWWETMWQPQGFKRSMAEIRKLPHILNKRSLQYLKLAEYLDLSGTKNSYEAHVTVKCKENDLDDWQRFGAICHEIGIKGIQIHLPQGYYPTHHITASWHVGPLEKVREEVYGIGTILKEHGLAPVRHKIEAMLNNSQVPVTDEDAKSRPREQYFEFHVKALHKEGENLETLQNICEKHGVHLSRSASNRIGSTLQRFITARYRIGREHAIVRFKYLLKDLTTAGFELSNRLKEYTIYDDNLEQDRGWADQSPLRGVFGVKIVSFCGNRNLLIRDTNDALQHQADKFFELSSVNSTIVLFTELFLTQIHFPYLIRSFKIREMKNSPETDSGLFSFIALCCAPVASIHFPLIGGLPKRRLLFSLIIILIILVVMIS